MMSKSVNIDQGPKLVFHVRMFKMKLHSVSTLISWAWHTLHYLFANRMVSCISQKEVTFIHVWTIDCGPFLDK
jgi:hypothetical protein